MRQKVRECRRVNISVFYPKTTLPNTMLFNTFMPSKFVLCSFVTCFPKSFKCFLKML